MQNRGHHIAGWSFISLLCGIIPNPDVSGLDSSTYSSNFVPISRNSFSEILTTTYKFHCAALLKLESH